MKHVLARMAADTLVSVCGETFAMEDDPHVFADNFGPTPDCERCLPPPPGIRLEQFVHELEKVFDGKDLGPGDEAWGKTVALEMTVAEAHALHHVLQTIAHAMLSDDFDMSQPSNMRDSIIVGRVGPRLGKLLTAHRRDLARSVAKHLVDELRRK